MDLLHLLNVFTAYRPTPFAKKLKQETRQQHDKIEAHPFVRKLILGTISDEEYFAYLENLYPIYTVVESRLLHLEEFKILRRTAQISDDLRAYQLDLNVHSTYKIYSKEWLESCLSKSNFELVSDFYIRWLGDLYGGQLMSKNFKYSSMLRFNNVRQGIRLARTLIETAAVDKQDEFIDLVNKSYDINYQLVDKLYSDFK